MNLFTVNKLIKYLFIFIFLFSTKIYGQKEKNKQFAFYIVSILNLHQKIDSVVNNNKEIFKKEINRIINDNHINSMEDIDYINSKIQEELTFEKSRIWNKIIFQLTIKKKKELKRYLKQIKKNKKREIIDKLNFNDFISNFSIKEFKNYIEVNLPQLIEIVKTRHKEIYVNIYLNNKKLQKTPRDFDLFVVTKSNKKLKVFDKEKLLLRRINNSKNVKQLEIIFQGNHFVFFPNDSLQAPKRLKKIINILSEYNFTKTKLWNIYITKTDKSISIGIENAGYMRVEKIILPQKKFKE